MIICICNNKSETDIDELIHSGINTIDDIIDAGVCNCCQCCKECIEEMLNKLEEMA